LEQWTFKQACQAESKQSEAGKEELAKRVGLYWVI
jgi:hypothetical protein